jgi:hypothetical protein
VREGMTGQEKGREIKIRVTMEEKTDKKEKEKDEDNVEEKENNSYILHLKRIKGKVVPVLN